MKIKSLYILLVTLVGLSTSIGLVSCSDDFLALAPETQLSAATFFKTEADFNQGLNGVYQSLRRNIGTSYFEASGWVTGELRSDNTHYEYYANDWGAIRNLDRAAVAGFLNTAQNTETKTKYIVDYAGISRANTIIDRIEASTLSEEFKKQISGEAKVIRAWFYLDLVQYFGGVPLYLHEVKSEDDASVDRSSVDEVYAAIIADANDAIQKLSAPKFPQVGKVSQGTAKMLLANVYMIQKKYPEAATLLTDITKMGYSLLPDYKSVYELNNKNSTESIFEIQFQQGNQGQQSNFIYHFIPRVINSTVITGVNTNNMIAGGWNIPTDNLLAAYEPGDKRLDASIGVVEGSINASGGFTPESSKSIVGYQTPAGKISKRFVKKYLHPHSTANNTDDNWPLYRYAEALLFLAESLNEQGKSAEALPFLNQVRMRAGLAASTVTDQVKLRDIIAHERRIELAFENKRWLDLVRTGKAIEVMTAFGAEIKQKDNTVFPNAYQLTPDKLIFAIPFTEIQRNPILKQNPGYQ
jgi:hypothetical protein